MTPLFDEQINGTPWHSSQYTALPEIYIQNASLEIGWTSNIMKDRTIAGKSVAPFFTRELEGFDINTSEDWILAEYYAQKHPDAIPNILQNPF